MSRGPHILLLPLIMLASLCAAGCHMIMPEVSYQPLVHNPFPQLSRVAVAPFFNQSDEPTVDGRQFALAYFAELQSIRGYEVVPVGVVEEAIIANRINLASPGEARRLANVLGVDAVVIGTVTDYSPYYPPRCGMRVEWYSANPGFHEIPAGYGLPWGTPEEEFIPERLVFEAEMALAKAQMATQSPVCAPVNETMHQHLPAVPGMGPMDFSGGHLGSRSDPAQGPTKGNDASDATNEPDVFDENKAEALPAPPADGADDVKDALAPKADDSASTTKRDDQIKLATFDAPIDSDASAVSPNGTTGATVNVGQPGMMHSADAIPTGWPDARGFTPAGPSPTRPACVPNHGPVMTHTRIYHGNDPDFTAALASYVSYRDDARFGGWQSYLERSDDFLRFCAHLHLAEMLTARGGGSETRVTRRWSTDR